MIPKNINRTHILKAIKTVNANGVPQNRGSKKYLLIFGGQPYPPKYIVSLANKYANRSELSPQKFGGGKETNNYLAKLGFEITCIKF